MNERDVLVDLRAWRDEFARLHDYDMSGMVAALKAMDRTVQCRVIRGAPRLPSPPRFELVAEIQHGIG